nr:MAG TPA: hypothetical protein [Caudoviricetes sp.]
MQRSNAGGVVVPIIMVSTIVSYHDKNGCPVENILPYLFTARQAGVVCSVVKDI